MSVTRLGVSLLNVVATIESPASHQGTERPEAKNCAVSLPERLPKKSAGAKQMPTASRAMIQSSAVRCMGVPFDSYGWFELPLEDCAALRAAPSAPAASPSAAGTTRTR